MRNKYIDAILQLNNLEQVFKIAVDINIAALWLLNGKKNKLLSYCGSGNLVNPCTTIQKK